jgi:hypothetical protein
MRRSQDFDNQLWESSLMGEKSPGGRAQEEKCFGASCRNRREQGYSTPTELPFNGSQSGGVESPDLLLLPLSTYFKYIL